MSLYKVFLVCTGAPQCTWTDQIIGLWKDLGKYPYKPLYSNIFYENLKVLYIKIFNLWDPNNFADSGAAGSELLITTTSPALVDCRSN